MHFPFLNIQVLLCQMCENKVCFNHLGDASVSVVWLALCSAPNQEQLGNFVRNLGKFSSER